MPAHHQSNKSVQKEMHINKLLLYTLVIKSYGFRLGTFLFLNEKYFPSFENYFEFHILNIFKSICGHFRFLCKFLNFHFSVWIPPNAINFCNLVSCGRFFFFFRFLFSFCVNYNISVRIMGNKRFIFASKRKF